MNRAFGMDNRFFVYALVFSFFVHTIFILFCSIPLFKFSEPKMKHIEVTFHKVRQPETKKQDMAIKDLDVLEKKKDSFKSDNLLGKPKGVAFEDKNVIAALSDSWKIAKKTSLSFKDLEKDKRITIPVITSEKITNTKYLGFQDELRNKIRLRAYSYVDHPDFRNGEVSVSFVLSSDGILKKVKILEAKTNANEYLRTIAIRSIQESHPFPHFPKDLNYPELTFNVLISFQLEQ